MKLFPALLILLTSLTACTTTEYVPVYVTVTSIEKPEPPVLEELSWNYIAEEELFTLEPEEFDKYRGNLQELDTYIKLLQEGWIYYETSTRQGTKD